MNSTNLCPIICLTLLLALAKPAWAVQIQSLPGHVPATTASLQPLGRLSRASRLNLTITLPLRDQEPLKKLLEQLYDPASPQYRHYLTPEQFAERFGPEKQDYEELIIFAKSQGLSVTGKHPNRTLLDVSGTVQNIERTFHVRMETYQHPSEGRTFYA